MILLMIIWNWYLSWFEVFFELRSFEEVDGWVLLDWKIDELLESSIPDPTLPSTYKIITAYMDSINIINVNNTSKFIMWKIY